MVYMGDAGSPSCGGPCSGIHLQKTIFCSDNVDILREGGGSQEIFGSTMHF